MWKKYVQNFYLMLKEVRFISVWYTMTVINWGANKILPTERSVEFWTFSMQTLSITDLRVAWCIMAKLFCRFTVHIIQRLKYLKGYKTYYFLILFSAILLWDMILRKIIFYGISYFYKSNEMLFKPTQYLEMFLLINLFVSCCSRGAITSLVGNIFLFFQVDASLCEFRTSGKYITYIILTPYLTFKCDK